MTNEEVAVLFWVTGVALYFIGIPILLALAARVIGWFLGIVLKVAGVK